ncbi:hypothetical protein CLV92_105284 [Kineococcus xinjiangensis]|uniref:Uncharacterized protein n=1 Tax=Kineococcus xinjiangensis TaxID=512762 RepID=A0A2S6IPJ8_9ACTN|nr:hypothetical protein [Kineococcus xinjiangensis]PPK96182.1 hypothetical protein CLV92_105284 [Kineococcus xinjiangensis]
MGDEVVLISPPLRGDRGAFVAVAVLTVGLAVAVIVWRSWSLAGGLLGAAALAWSVVVRRRTRVVLDQERLSVWTGSRRQTLVRWRDVDFAKARDGDGFQQVRLSTRAGRFVTLPPLSRQDADTLLDACRNRGLRRMAQ